MKAYTDSAKKVQARSETLYRPYRQRFGWPMAKAKQYITLSALCTDAAGILASSELGQALALGFIVPSQFHGVDTDRQTIACNRLSAPEANWHNDDLYEFIVRARKGGWLNPGLVNYDSLLMPKKGVSYAADLMVALSPFSEVIFTCNFILHSRTCVTTARKAVQMLHALPNFSKAVSAGWRPHKGSQAYRYNGTGKNGTAMCSLVFYKP